MKKIVLTGYFLFQFIILSFCQTDQPYGSLLFTDTLDFRPMSSWIKINTPISNTWKIGQPNKGSFNAAHSGKLTMVTDSVNMYANNLNDYFTITIPCSDNHWAEGILSFYHRYETDAKTDGGVIEVSYNDGVDWKNIRDDHNYAIANFIGLYTDTIKGGDYGFTGSSNGWKYAELHWVWMMVTKSSTLKGFEKPILRFRFISDNTNTNKEGWMIDDIVFRGYDVSGNVGELIGEGIKAFPNPTNGKIYFNLPEMYSASLRIEIIDIDGRIVLDKLPSNGQIDITNKAAGTYVYKIYYQNSLISSGKLIKL